MTGCPPNSARENLLTSHVAERDLDLLLAEELQSSESFRAWLQGHLTILHPGLREMGVREVSLRGLPAVLHSVSRDAGLGETDLEALWDATWTEGAVPNSGRLLLLFENKVGAAFQPDQAGRYHQEGMSRIKKGDALQYLTILFAPREYLADCAVQTEFDLSIPYEAVVEHLKRRLEDSEIPAEIHSRLDFKLRLLQQGIEKSRRGYQAIISPDATRFWQAYYELARREAPALCMKPPSAKPASSTFVYFTDAVDNGLSLCHKFELGRVDLMIRRASSLHAEVEQALSPILPQGAELRPLFARPGRPKSLAVSLPVPEVPALSVVTPDVLDRLGQGLKAARILQQWSRDKRSILQELLRRLRGR